MSSPADTILAIGSPPGQSARGILRLSGPGTADILASLLAEVPAEPRRMHAVRLCAPLPPLPALMLRFAAPASYTGEDGAEIQVPGNPALLDWMLRLGTAVPGCRLAEAGEFTFRAFRNGKLDLTQAEGVAATIHAQSEAQLRAAGELRRGTLSRQTAAQVDALGVALALVEAGIDFTDQDDVVPISPADLDARLARLESDLSALLSRSRAWGTLDALPRAVLVGRPSAGKSTLFNALLGRTRAVVHAAPGTTRDALEENLRLPTGEELVLVDVAGLDEAQTDLDAAAQEQAQAAIGRADVVVAVDDATDPQTAWPDFPCPVVSVRTKADLCGMDFAPMSSVPFQGAPISHALKAHETHGLKAHATIPLCAPTGQGLPELRQALADALAKRRQSARADELALQPRHEAALREGLFHLRAARQTLAPHTRDHALPAIERLAGQLRAALDALAALGGTLTPDEIIGKVFSTFCVGK